MNDTDFLKALLAACAGATALQDADIQALAAALQDQVTGLGTAKGLDLSTPIKPKDERRGFSEKQEARRRAKIDYDAKMKALQDKVDKFV